MIDIVSIGLNMNTRVVTAHIPNELAEQIDQLAARLDRPKGWIVKQTLPLGLPLKQSATSLPWKVWRMSMPDACRSRFN